MTLKPASIADDLLWLYELSLTVGQRLDPTATARDFLRVLVARRNLTGGAIWWRRDGATGGLCLLDAYPRVLGVDAVLSREHVAWQALRDGVPCVVPPGDAAHAELARGSADVVQQSYAVCPLGDDGVLMMCSVSAEVFSPRLFGSLRAVLGKLTTAIQGGMSHVRLVESEKELAQQRRFLKTLVQTLPDLVWLKDRNGTYVTCNARFEQFVGVPEPGIVGLTDHAFVEPDLAEFFRANDRRAIEHGGWKNEEWLTFADGHRELVETTKTPMYDDEGALVGVLGIAHDVTESRDLQRRLAEERDRSQRYLDTVEAIIVSLDADGRITLLNRKGCDVLGYEAAELIGASWFERCLPQPAGTEVVLPVFRKLMNGQNDGVDRFENEIVTRSGELRLIAWRNAILKNELGDIVGTLSAGDDVTEYRRAETELARYRDHLEALVEERTEALSIAKEAAEAASRAKSAFLANMSHELRTPMNAIMGMTYIALRRTEDPRLRDPLGKISQAAQHLLAVINDVLDISRIEAERITLERVPFRPGEVLNDLIDMVAYRAADKGITLDVDIAPEIAGLAVVGDPLRLKQILLNLLGNAIKFTDRGSVLLSVRRIDDPTANIALRFEVRDTGIGIAESDRGRLFDAFEQADASQTRKYGGAGLGLAICKRLVQLMGGELGVTSWPGSGSAFWFTLRLLPAGNDAVLADAATETIEVVEARLRHRHAGKRILLAEDEPVNREVSRELLASTGLRVDVVEDGCAAIEMARVYAYAMILLDLQMPCANGLDAARKIRGMSAHATTPIIAMTANAFDDDRRACFDAGMNDHIGKPVDPVRLYAKILEWLDRQPGKEARSA